MSFDTTPNDLVTPSTLADPPAPRRGRRGRLPAWAGSPRTELLAGLLVAVALIPEAIAFSIIAGVDPMVGLYASFAIAVVITFTGGHRGPHHRPQPRQSRPPQPAHRSARQPLRTPTPGVCSDRRMPRSGIRQNILLAVTLALA